MIEKLSATTNSATEAGNAAYLVCAVGRQLHAIPIEHVIEVMRALPVEPMARAPRYVLGICIVRGIPTPVVDVGRLIGERQSVGGKLIAVRAQSRTLALQVDDVPGIRTLNAAIYNELPPLLRDIDTETVAGIGMLDSALLLLLRVGRIVPDELFEEIERIETTP
jgi:purine-binding chemotaxis protein CheW